MNQAINSIRTEAVASGAVDPTRVITVRLPRSLHEDVRKAVWATGDVDDSMNKWCIRAIQHDLEPQKRNDDMLIKAIRNAVQMTGDDFAKLLDLLLEESECKSLDDRRQAGLEICRLVLPEEYGQEAGKEVAASESSNRR